MYDENYVQKRMKNYGVKGLMDSHFLTSGMLSFLGIATVVLKHKEVSLEILYQKMLKITE